MGRGQFEPTASYPSRRCSGGGEGRRAGGTDAARGVNPWEIRQHYARPSVVGLEGSDEVDGVGEVD